MFCIYHVIPYYVIILINTTRTTTAIIIMIVILTTGQLNTETCWRKTLKIQTELFWYIYRCRENSATKVTNQNSYYMDTYPVSINLINFNNKCSCSLKATVLQILRKNHELCKYAKIYLHIHTIVDLNQNIALNLHMFTVLLRKQTIRVSAIGIYLL